MTDREKLVAIMAQGCRKATEVNGIPCCRESFCKDNQKHCYGETADHLVAHGVVVQDDIKEMVGRGLDNIHWRIYGANKEFNDRMSAHNPSAFCAGFEYAIQLAKGLLTQLPQPPKEVE